MSQSNSGNKRKSPTPGTNPWPETKDGYVIEEAIGSGATSVVQSAFCSSKNMRVAIKRIDLERCPFSMDEMQKEIQAMSRCNHENVASYYTSFIHNSELWIVMKLHDGGSVLDIINQVIEANRARIHEGVIPEPVIAVILKEVLKGLVYFHENGQIHRDVKAGNILLGMDGTVQLADFGVSSTIQDYDDIVGQKSRKTFVGTPCWMAPEVMEQVTGYNNKVDIWSFGITAIELATGTAPYAKFPAMKVLKLTLLNDPPTLESCADNKPDSFKKYSKLFRKMIHDCLQKNPDVRPDAKVLLKHKFFKNVKNKDVLQDFMKNNIKNIRERSNKVDQYLCSSGRMHRTDSGDWIWSDAEAENTKKDQIENNNKEDEKKPEEIVKIPKEAIIFHISFRVRSNSNEINEISFGFHNQKDTYDRLVQEMIEYGIINGQNRVVVAANLEKVISAKALNKKFVFALADDTDIFDEDRLLGYADLTLFKIEKL